MREHSFPYHHVVVGPHTLHSSKSVDPAIHRVHYLVERSEEAEGARDHLLTRIVQHVHGVVARWNLLVARIAGHFLEHAFVGLMKSKQGSNLSFKLTRHLARNKYGREGSLRRHLNEVGRIGHWLIRTEKPTLCVKSEKEWNGMEPPF